MRQKLAPDRLPAPASIWFQVLVGGFLANLISLMAGLASAQTVNELPSIRGEIVLTLETPQCDPPGELVDGSCPEGSVQLAPQSDAEEAGQLMSGSSDVETTKTAETTEILLTPDVLRDGRLDLDYGREFLTATGGTRPYRYDLSAGRLPPGLELSPEGALTGTPQEPGNFVFNITATDWDKNTGENAYIITVYYPGTIKAPQAADTLVIQSCPPKDLQEDGTCGDAQSGTQVAGTAPGAAGSGPPTASVDGATFKLPPGWLEITPRKLRAGRVEVDYGREVLTARGGQPPYIFKIVAGWLPPGLKFLPEGALVGVPLEPGIFEIAVTAEDTVGGKGYISYRIAVSEPGTITAPAAQDSVVIMSCPPDLLQVDGTCRPREPVAPDGTAAPLAIQPDALFAGTVDYPYGPHEVTVTGGRPPYTVQMVDVDSRLSQFLGFDEMTNGNGFVLEGEPSEPDYIEKAFTFIAADADGQVISKTYDLNVVDQLSVFPKVLPRGEAGQKYGPVTFSAAGGIPPYEVIVASEDLPSKLGLDNSETGPEIQLSGVPLRKGAHREVLEIAVVDSTGAFAVQLYDLEITETACPDGLMYRLAGECTCPVGMSRVGDICEEPIELTPPALADGRVNAPYIPVQFIASGTGPYVYSVKEEDGGLPEGMMLSETGRLSGTPTRAGPHGFVVELRRGAALVKSEVYRIEIADVTIDVFPSELPGGNVAELYSYILEAQGGTAPYEFRLVGVGPDWLSLSPTGTLRGVPQNEGSAVFTVVATDANGNTSIDTRYSIPVDAQICPYPGMIAVQYSEGSPNCECKPTLFPYSSGQGCGPCEDGQKPFGGICPDPVTPVQDQTVTTKPTCSGGMVLQANGICACPSEKPRVVNGVCQAPQKPTVTQQPAKPKPQNSGFCRPGDLQFDSRAARTAHQNSSGGSGPYTIQLGSGKQVFCLTPGVTPQAQPTPQPRLEAPPQQQPQNQCNQILVALICAADNLSFDPYNCSCGAPLPGSNNNYGEGENYESENYEGESYE